jgi:LysM repeat protein
LIQVGQKLLVHPATSAAVTTNETATAAAPAITVLPANQVAAATISTYRVKRGDTLSRIASSTGTSVAQLRAANGLRNDLIQVGQKLLVHPATSAAVTTNEATTAAAPAITAPSANQVASATISTHRVKRGETLWRIARLYGTTTDVLAAKNNLASDILQVGQTLRIK